MSCRKKLFLLVTLLAAFTLAVYGPSYAAGETAVYTAPDGFKVVSYSTEWADVKKLGEVYQELLRNTHGEEIKLLRRINIYGGADPDGMSFSGRWYGEWTIKDGRPYLTGNRYIDIYNGDKYTTIQSIARTLAHEYGHHFTYYYFFRQEKRLWEDWKKSGLAAVRGLQSNPQVGASGREHAWLIQEIAAEDYVQLFGSPNAKVSYDFKDIAERVNLGQSTIIYSSDTYNYHPQENYQLPLAANIKGLREYWVRAAGFNYRGGQPPAPVALRLKEVNQLERVTTPQYVFAWDQSSDDRSGPLEYTLVCFTKNGSTGELYPVKTVTDGEPLQAVFGSAKGQRVYMWEELPGSMAYFVLYTKDGDGLVTSSPVLAVDFTNPLEPETVEIEDKFLSSGMWFPVRVKVGQNQLAFDVAPVIQKGRTLVPLRAIFEELEAAVGWDPGSQTIRAVKGSTEVVLRIGESTAWVNGEEVLLDSPPVIVNGMTLIPLRFVSEALGAAVSWNRNMQLAKISM